MEQLEYANLGSQVGKAMDHGIWTTATGIWIGCAFLALYKPRSIAQKGFGLLTCMSLKHFIVDGLVVEHSLRKYCLTQNDILSQELRNLYQFYDPKNPFIGEIIEKAEMYLESAVEEEVLQR